MPSASGHHPPRPAWSRRQVLQGTAGLAALTLARGSGERRRDAGAPTLACTALVDLAAADGTLGARALGFSFERATLPLPLFDASNGPLVALFRLLGPGVLRLGGNSVDRVGWDPAGPGLTAGVVAPADLARLRGFLDAVDWTALHCTPFVSPGASAASVADEVGAVSSVLGPRLDGVELCNEPDLYLFDPAHAALAGTFASFSARWHQFAAAARGSVPDVPLTGPAACLLDSIGGWTTPFATAEAGGLSQLTQHYYRGFGLGPQTIDLLLTPDPQLRASLPALGAATGLAGAPRGVRLAETNSFANGGQPGVSNTLAAALWAVDHHLTACRSGAAGLNFHNSGTGAGYPAIVQVGGAVTQVRPLYAGLLLLAQLGEGTFVRSMVTPDDPAVRLHALVAPDGVARAVVVNTDGAAARDVTVDVGAAIGRASVRRLTGPDLAATTGVTLGGVPVGIDGTWAPPAADALTTSGTRVGLTVGPGSAAVVELHLLPPVTTVPGERATTTTAPVAATPGAPVAAPLSGEPRYTG